MASEPVQGDSLQSRRRNSTRNENESMASLLGKTGINKSDISIELTQSSSAVETNALHEGLIATLDSGTATGSRSDTGGFHERSSGVNQVNPKSIREVENESFCRDIPWWFKILPRCWTVAEATSPLDATGCAIDLFARAPIFLTTIFLGPALLEVARDQALREASANSNMVYTSVCTEGNEDDTTCWDESEARVYGFRPSSLLTNIAVVAGLVGPIIIPMVGAVIDHTHWRHKVGAWSAYGLALIKFIELCLSSSTWFIVANLQIASTILYQLHTVVVYAYASALSQNAAEQSHFQTRFFLSMYVGMLLFMIAVLLPANLFNFDHSDKEINAGNLSVIDESDIRTARWAILVAVLTCSPLFWIAWELMFRRDCPPLSKLGPTQSLWTAGFTKLYETYKTVAHEKPCIRTFLLTIPFSESADTALATIATTFMSEYLDLSSLEIGLVILVVLVAGIPGTLLGNLITARYNNPVVSAQICLALYGTTTIAAAFLLTPQRSNLSYLFGVLWGMCQGWMHPQHTTIFVALAPPGSMAWMGLFLFTCQVFSFLPPAIFSALNEVGVTMRWGMASLIFYFGIGWIGLTKMKPEYEREIASKHTGTGHIV